MMSHRTSVCAFILLALPTAAHSQRSGQRIVLQAEAPCRDNPATGAHVVRSYRLGDVIDADDSAPRGGTTWYSTETVYVSGLHPSCWIAGETTTSFDRSHPEIALDTLTRRMLQVADSSLRFEDLVASENLLIGRYAFAFQESGLLQYRRLLIVERANAALNVLKESPLEIAWLLAHRTFLAQDPFADGLYPLAQPYWALYDRFKTAPWADELAWKAAQLRPPTDECYSDCVLTVGIVEGPMQYWKRLPHGKSIGAALDAAIKAAKYATDFACYDRQERAPSKSESPVRPELLQQIRTSLTAVTVASKRTLLAQLAEAEAKCR